MIKLNSVLASVLVVCALALVTSQHRARKLFSELAQEQDVGRQIDVEWGQLQLEQSTWAMHSRIEKIASGYLRMRLPASGRMHLVTVEGNKYVAAVPESRGATTGATRRGAPANQTARAGVKR